LFTNNDEFLEVSSIKQDPLYSFQGHVSYTIKSGIWFALNAAFFAGGETSVDGESKKDFQSNWRAGATVSVPIALQHFIKVLYHLGVATRIGSNLDVFTIAYQYTWY